MISDKMIAALNNQIQMEAKASFLYLSMAAWCEDQGLDGCAKFMFAQSDEEKEHMMRIFRYLLEMDARPVTPAIKSVPHDWKSIKKMFEEVYSSEKAVSKSINELTDLANKLNDHYSFNFLQWYVTEQQEEEALVRGILDKIRIIGSGPQSLYFIDKEIEAINAKEEHAEGDA